MLETANCSWLEPAPDPRYAIGIVAELDRDTKMAVSKSARVLAAASKSMEQVPNRQVGINQ